MIATLILPFLIGLGAMSAHSVQCKEVSANDKPAFTVQFTPPYPVQIAPTSTVYGAIVTSHMNVVDCKYVMVGNVNDNPVQSGIFTERTTIPVLTLYRVGCMEETSIITRRNVQVPETKTSAKQQTTVPTTAIEGEHAKMMRAELEGSSPNTLLAIADRLSFGLDPTNENMTVGEFRFLREINTALFALNIINAGLPLGQMCQYLHDPSIGNRLDDNLINQSQAANIVCFASVYGLYFQQSNEELLEDLAALEYAIQMKAYSSETLREVCEGLDYQAASFLDIDVQGIRDRVCNGTGGIMPSTSVTTMSLTTPTPLYPPTPLHSGTGFGGYPPETGTAHSTGSWTRWTPRPTGSQIPSTAVPVGPGSMSPTFGPTSSIIFGSNGPSFSSATSAAGTIAPWFNITAEASSEVTKITPSARGPAAESPSTNPSFYMPPRVFHDRLHRHHRAM